MLHSGGAALHAWRETRIVTMGMCVRCSDALTSSNVSAKGMQDPSAIFIFGMGVPDSSSLRACNLQVSPDHGMILRAENMVQMKKARDRAGPMVWFRGIEVPWFHSQSSFTSFSRVADTDIEFG